MSATGRPARRKLRDIIPRSLKICGHRYTIKVLPRAEMDSPTPTSKKENEDIGRRWTHYGSAYLDPGKQEIYVLDSLKLPMAAETTLHEALHVLVELKGVRSLFKRGQEEAIVQALGNGLTDLLRGNKKLRLMFEP